jgi:hypothetical protein
MLPGPAIGFGSKGTSSPINMNSLLRAPLSPPRRSASPLFFPGRPSHRPPFNICSPTNRIPPPRATTTGSLPSVLEMWRTEQEPVNGWLFGNIQTGRPFWRGQLQKNHLVPLGNRHRIPHLGWHAFRHTYRAMMRELQTPLEMQRTLMRHSDINTTFSYGEERRREVGRPSNKKVVEMLKNRA